MALNSRKKRRNMRRADMRASRIENGMRKRTERTRRDVTMTDLVKKGQLPYTPRVLSWLSAKLDKPGRLITADDVKTVVK